MYFYHISNILISKHKNPSFGGHEIYKLGEPLLGHRNYILSSSDLCSGVEKQIIKEIMNFYYMKYGHALAQKKSCPGSHEFTISIDYSSVTSVITINSLCQNSAQDYRRMTLFTRKLCTIGVEEMVVIFKIWHLLTTQVIHTNGVICFWRRRYMYSQTTEDEVAILTNGSPQLLMLA